MTDFSALDLIANIEQTTALSKNIHFRGNWVEISRILFDIYQGLHDIGPN
jgi:hypothetical protein